MPNYSEYKNRSSHNINSIVNKIIGKRAYPGNRALSFLIVEGTDDKKFYEWYVENSKCDIQIPDGKENAIAILSALEKANFCGVLAIVDTDFDILNEMSSTSPNLLLTDTHDLETMILQSRALEKVLSAFGSEEKIQKFLERTGKEFRSVLLGLASPLGYLRWLSLRENLSLTFEGLKFEKFIDRETLVIDEGKLIRCVQALSTASKHKKSLTQSVTDNALHNKVQRIKHDSHDPWHVCCGHDLVHILSLGLRKAIGTTNVTEPDLITQCLMLAYDTSYFTKTKLYLSIKDWEYANPPFIILSL